VFLAGALNSLSQTAIKLTAPGIPDIYQGAELWDLTLVDPDNRRPIDFDAYQALQNATAGMAMSDLLRDWRSGAIKLRLIEAVLTLRQRATALFAEAQYVPLTVEGTAAQHAIAFARVGAGNAVVTIAPRACLDLLRSATTPLVPAQSWGETVVELPESLAGCRWRNVVTGGMHAATSGLAVGEALRQFPVAILANEDLQ
jgi:(1->4)-alpha-D-glucan 1-alpha-D-glucosylmutase